MSVEGGGTSLLTKIVDVDCSVKEVDDGSKITNDLGCDTLEACSASVNKPSDVDLIVENDCESAVKRPVENATENSDSDSLASSCSLSPEEEDKSSKTNENLEELTPSNACRSDTGEKLSEESSVEDNSEDTNVKVIDHTSETIRVSQENVQETVTNNESLEVIGKPGNFTIDNEAIENCPKALMTSTMSLNEDLNTVKINKTTLNKTAFSKSAENVSSMTQPNETTINSSQNDLNAEKILSEFTSQKPKVSATQKILPDTTPVNLDVRYSRLSKELLNQDLGSIYKNVHGIFSTVSGSLKNAYNISHRVTTQKPPPKPVSKPVLNTKIFTEIFEEDSPSIIKENGVDKQDSGEEIPHKTTEICEEPDGDAKTDVCRLQVETLERLLAEQRKEMTILRDRVRQQANEMQEKGETFKDFEAKMDLMRRSVEQAQREKDAAVMRYASGERHIIEARRAAETATQKERAAAHELELASGKLKSAHAEKQRICQLYDDKCHELLSCERELAKSREEARELEGRLKWTQNRLRSELEAYKSSAERVESLQQRVSELEAATESAGACAADSARAKQLESELKETQAALILCRHENSALDKKVTSLSQQLEACERERDEACGALARTTAEVQQLRSSNLSLEEEAASLAALGARAALADTLTAQLEREKEARVAAEAAAARAAAARDTCSAREAAALRHAAALTARHARAAAAVTAARQEAQALSADNAALRVRLAVAEDDLSGARAALASEAERRNRESRMLARKVAELTEELAEVTKKLEWEKGENGVLKKKHSSTIKELNRELQRSLKRCEQLEAKVPQADERETRAGSVSSVSSAESGAPVEKEERIPNGNSSDALPDIHVRSADRQALIERIVSLQRAAARRAERCDFLEEHAKQLTDELRNKSRALRHLLCSTPAGVLASGDSDQHKRDIARLGGGAMAAVWGGDASGMTLELSLEMNKRLQAVLEDTLLKNITLKENMDTLGKEISKLKAQKAVGVESK